MDMIKVQSSSVKEVGYDEDNQTLLVEFKGGGFGQYSNFTEDDWVSLRSVIDSEESVGSYLHKEIKPKHKYTPLSKHKTTKGREGFLAIGGEITTNNPIKSNIPEAHCPACGTEAVGFEPPMSDERYVTRLKIEKEAHGVESDEEAHMLILKANGGYIDICIKCGVSFFVPFKSSKLRS